MQTMNISLPETLKNFVDQQIAAGRYSSASEYVRELIRNDEKRKAEDRLTALLREGLQSEETVLTSEDWKAVILTELTVENVRCIEHEARTVR